MESIDAREAVIGDWYMSPKGTRYRADSYEPDGDRVRMETETGRRLVISGAVRIVPAEPDDVAGDRITLELDALQAAKLVARGIPVPPWEFDGVGGRVCEVDREATSTCWSEAGVDYVVPIAGGVAVWDEAEPIEDEPAPLPAPKPAPLGHDEIAGRRYGWPHGEANSRAIVGKARALEVGEAVVVAAVEGDAMVWRCAGTITEEDAASVSVSWRMEGDATARWSARFSKRSHAAIGDTGPRVRHIVGAMAGAVPCPLCGEEVDREESNLTAEPRFVFKTHTSTDDEGKRTGICRGTGRTIGEAAAMRSVVEVDVPAPAEKVTPDDLDHAAPTGPPPEPVDLMRALGDALDAADTDTGTDEPADADPSVAIPSDDDMAEYDRLDAEARAILDGGLRGARQLVKGVTDVRVLGIAYLVENREENPRGSVIDILERAGRKLGHDDLNRIDLPPTRYVQPKSSAVDVDVDLERRIERAAVYFADGAFVPGWGEGVRAYKDGRPEGTCAYADNTMEAAGWRAGWRSELAKAREEDGDPNELVPAGMWSDNELAALGELWRTIAASPAAVVGDDLADSIRRTRAAMIKGPADVDVQDLIRQRDEASAARDSAEKDRNAYCAQLMAGLTRLRTCVSVLEVPVEIRDEAPIADQLDRALQYLSARAMAAEADCERVATLVHQLAAKLGVEVDGDEVDALTQMLDAADSLVTAIADQREERAMRAASDDLLGQLSRVTSGIFRLRDEHGLDVQITVGPAR